MTITMLSGLGCHCTPAHQVNGLGATTDYDKITVGGKTYTANQLVDKTVIAAKDTKLYSNSSGTGAVVGVVKAGQPIGVVYSYIKPNQGSSDGRSWLMFESSTYNKFYYVPNEAASSSGLKEQGTKTLDQEVKEEEEKKEKDENPVGFYLKKYGLPALLIIGGIVIVGGIAKEAVKAKLTPHATT